MILLDTHTFIWTLSNRDMLSPAATKAIIYDDTAVSITAFWEIQIKKSLGKLAFDFDIRELFNICHEQNISLLPVLPQHIAGLDELPYIHRDPFDRILISQARTEHLTIVTKDKIIPKYDVSTLW